VVGDLEGAHLGLLARQRSDRHALAADRAAVHAGVAVGRFEQVVDADPELPGEREQQFQARLPLARLESGERAGRHAGALRELVERPSALLPRRPQPGAEPLQFVHHAPSLPILQT
jgi:hypothetical protein